jgi:serine/threonine protein kinase
MPKYDSDLLKIANFYDENPQCRDYKFLNSISFQIFDVLKYLRENKYFHNDIKLDNFLLDSDNNVILTDFSLGYKTDVDYSTQYDRGTLLFCSKHILNKFVNIKVFNRDNLLEIYKKNKSMFLNSEVFKNNSLSELDFEKLDEDKKYQFLIKRIKI